LENACYNEDVNIFYFSCHEISASGGVSVAGSHECGDEPFGSGATELVSQKGSLP
jgi:hypothetical protein